MSRKDMTKGKPVTVPEIYRPNFVAALDGRCRVAKELNYRITSLQNDLGGVDNLSYQLRSVVERTVHMEALIMAMERDLAEGREVPIGVFTQSVNSLIGLFKTIGLERRGKDISLGEYLKTKTQEVDQQ